MSESRAVKKLILYLMIATVAPCFGSPSEKVLEVANNILKNYQVSYFYGGHSLKSEEACTKCNECLKKRTPHKKLRLKTCPDCTFCSLDCSHFTQLVFKKSGFKSPYLTTNSMNSLTKRVLLEKFSLWDLGRRIDLAKPADLLVYRGHVVILEKKRSTLHGDIIHATGGKEFTGPGEGVQRERNVPLINFRGPLLRILRHKELMFNKNTHSFNKIQNGK